MKPELLNILSKNEENLGSGSTPSSTLSGPFYKTDADRTGNPYIIPLIAGERSRDNNSPASGWSSSGYWTTFYTYYSGTNDAIQRYGYARPHGATKNNYSNQQHGSGSPHQLIYAKNSSVGMASSHSPGGGSSTSYNGFLTGMMFIKNPTATSQTVNIYNGYSNYWSSGHDGSSCTVYLPNASTKAATTGVNISQVWSRTGGNSVYDDSGSFTLPAGRTAAVVCCNTHHYHTTYSSGMHNTAVQYWNSLSSTLGACIPDYNMYATVLMTKAPQASTGAITSTGTIASDWKRCHDIFGD